MKRDLYYSQTALFQSQNISDAAILRFSRSTNVHPSSLPLVPSTKGLVFGPVRWKGESGQWESAIRAPNSVPFRPQLVSCPVPIVVIEKESFFHLLCSSSLIQSRKIALVTAKGYPDVSTRSFLYMASNGGSMPIFVLYVVLHIDFHPKFQYDDVRNAVNVLTCSNVSVVFLSVGRMQIRMALTSSSVTREVPFPTTSMHYQTAIESEFPSEMFLSNTASNYLRLICLEWIP